MVSGAGEGREEEERKEKRLGRKGKGGQWSTLVFFSFFLLSPFFPSHSPADNPPCDLHFCDSLTILVVCLGFFFLGSVVDSCEFIVILLFIVFDLFLFLNSLQHFIYK